MAEAGVEEEEAEVTEAPELVSGRDEMVAVVCSPTSRHSGTVPGGVVVSAWLVRM